LAVVRELLKATIGRTVVNVALVNAATKGHADVVSELLKALPDFPAREVAFFKAAEKGHGGVVKELLQSTAALDQTLRKKALFLGTYLLRENVVSVFLEAGVDPTARQEALVIADTDKRNYFNLA
jgi:hypothetical protein